MGISCKVIPAGYYDANCIIVSDDAANAWIVDPGGDADIIAERVKAAGLMPRRILCTHGHIDHIFGLDGLLAAFPGVPVMMHKGDAAWCFTEVNLLPPFPHLPARPETLAFYGDGETITDGGLSAAVMHTPGHSPGSVCIALDGGPLLSGDTLFQRSIGRYDLPGGDYAQLTASLTRLTALDGATKVIPGHGGETTIGDEIKWNPYLQQMR